MNLKTLAAAAALSFISTALLAHDFKIGDLTVDHPMAFETAPSAMAGGGFMTITNTGTEADRLIAVRADFPKVEIHQTVVTDGVGQMLPVEAIDIAPGATVTLQPGSYHVMFMGLQGRQLKEGEEVPATLVFERAGELPVVFSVEKRPMGGNMQHGGHSMAPSN
ncbi:MAG: copper chaperone PCu(A)C [Paracoccaceae bacterium]